MANSRRQILVVFETRTDHICALVQVALLEYVVAEFGQRQIFQFSAVASELPCSKAFYGSELGSHCLFLHLSQLAIFHRQLSGGTPQWGRWGYVSREADFPALLAIM